MNFKIAGRFHFYFRIAFIFFVIQAIVRCFFIFERSISVIGGIDTLFDGFLWDLGTWMILSIPLMLLSLFTSDKMNRAFRSSYAGHIATFLFTFIFVFIGLCELIFWNEFHSRFNFIAVDYLVYTNEVLRNIQESYSMGLIFSGVFIVAGLLTYLTAKIKYPPEKELFLHKTVTLLITVIILPFIFISFIGPWLEVHDEDFREDQMARNGAYEFVRAFRSNKIDYQTFYPTIPNEDVRNYIATTKRSKTAPPFTLSKKKPNIVMIVVESLGAKFIGPLSNNQDTTPFLNNLSNQAIFFENFYATGTRTVRGLEALSLSVPPTPGYAVVKRPEHKDLYSMGNTFKENGYKPIFIYGGRGFFDNMNSFFSGNKFQVIDQGDFKDEEITFSNAWGVCDEDLFQKAKKTIAAQDKNSPFLMFLLTTSNHRPFTYPDEKVDIPSGTSRAGAVKYTDFAIGSFLTEAKKEEWFKDTIFIIVADHSTEGRGQFDLEMKDFHIPLWIYSPELLKPQRMTKLGSQIDLLPSLIHLLGLKDDSPFYGQSLFDPSWDEERAFVGNYQFVGYYKNQVLTTLGPNRVVRNYSYDPVSKKQLPMGESPYLNEAISYYQSASHLLDSGMFKHPDPKVSSK